MFDSPIEWAIVVLVILVLFGTKKLPEFARNVGRASGEFTRGKMEIEREIRAAANPASPSSSGNESVVNAARALGIDTSNKDETVLRREISDKLKTS
ncbi:MAG: twin-arginine translocase TatA/TatE family subunit [Thermoplasmataceae archaeon]|jgi:sec-independent protein translocase protein TatA|nr:twin-arginine translocase TatA/TatE family subunit [Candidatus Thermoplasmatota archaeon]MCL5439878.1 twin-arginine translocase TatA/TatE family subunit [Candidatus Thermoplasmatota archaeon]